MSYTGEKKWHLWRYPQPHTNSYLKLGSILENPANPEHSLNLQNIATIPENALHDDSLAVRRIVRETWDTEKGARLQATLPGIEGIISAGAGAGVGRGSHSDLVVKMLNVRATIVMPDGTKDYMSKALLNPEIEDAARKGRWKFGKPLYMIVGVATCTNLEVKEANSRKSSGFMDASVSATGIAEGGVGLMASQAASHESSVTVDEECDFAYRVRQFKYSLRKRKFTDSNDYNTGSLFDADDDAVLEEQPMLPEFEAFVEADEDWNSSCLCLGG